MTRVYEEFDPAFAAICSDVTIYSSNKGFFKNLAEEIVSLADIDGWLHKFENIEDEKKVTAVLENSTIMNALSEVLSRIQPLFRGKDARISHEKRLAAQASLAEGDLIKSLAFASHAVLRAPGTGNDDIIDNGLSLALWLRSEILLRLNRPAAALEDLKLALKERLPARMRADYYWRMGHCYKGTGEPTRAKVSYELASRLMGGNEEAKVLLAKDVESLDYSIKTKHPPEKPEVIVTGGVKQNLPALSKKLKIVEEKDKGRFAVADDEINVGDILLIDKPYAACLLSDYYGSHCLHCFKRLENCDNGAPIWCPRCSGVAFCGTECRDNAVSTYHAFECQFLDLFIGSGMSILSHIALRMVTQAGLDTSQQIHAKYLNNKLKTVQNTVLNNIERVSKKNKLKSRKENLNRTKKALNNFENQNKSEAKIQMKIEDKVSFHEKLEMSAFQIYSLCTHSTQRKGTDHLKRIIMGIFLTECLKRAGFFKDCCTENLPQAEKNICELLVCNLQLLQFNAHEIYETVRGRHLFSGSKPIYIAVGLYPTGSLFNHECYPAVARYFDRQNIILRAIRPLRLGEVVSENYGPHFLMRGLKERQRMLACRYWFRCECIACQEDWPTLKQMEGNTALYLRCTNDNCLGKLCKTKNVPDKCATCSNVVNKELYKMNLDNINKCQSKYQEAAKLMEREYPEEAIRTISDAIESFYKVARPPHRDTHIAQESLRSCYATKGDMYIVRSETKVENEILK